MTGDGVTEVGPEGILLINGDRLKLLDGRTLTNRGVFQWNGRRYTTALSNDIPAPPAR